MCRFEVFYYTNMCFHNGDMVCNTVCDMEVHISHTHNTSFGCQTINKGYFKFMICYVILKKPNVITHCYTQGKHKQVHVR